MGSEPQFARYPNLSLAQNIFSLAVSPSSAQHTSLKNLQDAIKEHKMAPLYRHLAHPTEGVLNSLGESTSKAPSTPLPTRRGSLVSSNLLPPKKSVRSGLLPWDESLYEELKADNEKELESIQKEETDAEEAAGETEVQAARSKRAEFWARVGDKVGYDMLRGRNDANTDSRTKPSHPTKLFSIRLALWELKSISSWP
jgi:26S proteasome regulatory subunit N7